MSTEKTYLKKDTTAGNSESTDVVVIEKISIYQNRFLIVAGSLLATWFVIVAAGKRNGGQHFESIAAYETEVGVGGGGAVDSIVPVTSTDSALNMDIFGIANSDSSCVGRYHLCAGAGRGNCCEGLECDGPLFGTCQLSCNLLPAPWSGVSGDTDRIDFQTCWKNGPNESQGLCYTNNEPYFSDLVGVHCKPKGSEWQTISNHKVYRANCGTQCTSLVLNH